MSTSIFYRTMFITVGAHIIPMVESGDNNVYEAGSGTRMRRARDWYNSYWLTDKKNILATPETILNNLNAHRDELAATNSEYKDEKYGYYTAFAVRSYNHTTTFKQLVNFVKSGIKNAKTVEEYRSHRITFTLTTSRHTEDRHLNGKERLEDIQLQTTEQAFAAIERYATYYAGTNASYFITMDTGRWMTEHYFNSMKKKRKSLEPKQMLKLKEFYVLRSLRTGDYFVKNTARAMVNCSEVEAHIVRRFPTQVKAEKHLKKMRRGSYYEVHKHIACQELYVPA